MIENTNVYKMYTADGTQRQWEFPYSYVEDNDMRVYQKHDTTLTRVSSSLYTFDPVTKKVTYPKDQDSDPVPAGDIILIWRWTDVTQEEDSAIANFKSNDVERMTDKLTMICQELSDRLDRSITWDPTELDPDTDAVTLVESLEQYADNAAGTAVAQHNVSNYAHTSLFNSKQDVIEDLTTIRSNATAGKSASDTIATYGNIVTHDTSEFATAVQGAKADTALQQSDVTSSYSATGTSPVNGTAVASAVSGEASVRQSSDVALQSQIDGLKAASDVVDVVATYAELQSYDTSKLTDKDLIKVLSDSTHNNAETYYRWSASSSSFSYVGSAGASYTKAQADAKFLSQTDAASTYVNNTALSTALATKASSADGTTITDSGSAISTVAVKEQRANTAIKQWVGTKAQYTALESKDSNTIYVITDETDAEAITVDSALSTTSIHPVQNKVITEALQNLDALPSQTGQAGKFLTTDGTSASWGTPSGTVDQTYDPTSANAQSGTAVAEAVAPCLQNTATGTNSFSIGPTTGSTGAKCISIGKEATTSTYSNAVVIGNTASAQNSGTVAVGSQAKAWGANSIAIGSYTFAYSLEAIAIGAGNNGCTANANKAIQLGEGSNTTANSFQVFNYQMLDANGHIPNERIYYPQPLYKGYTITGSDVTVNDNNIASGFTSYGNQDNRNSYLLVNNKIPNSFGLLEMYVGFTCGNYNEDKGYSLITRNDTISTTWYVQGNSSDNTDYRIQRWNGTANVVGSTSLSKDQSYVARYIYNKTNGNTEQCDLYINGAWVNQWNNSNVNVTWNNIYVGIGGAYCYGDTSQTGSINLNQTAIYVDGVCLFNGVKNWIPSTAAITGVPGYSSSGTQVLKSVNGVLQWVTE